MPDRALIPLIAALAGGFIAGIITAVTQTYGGDALTIAVLAGIPVAIAGLVSVVKAPGEESERWIVGALRAAVAVACYGFLFGGLLIAVRDGNILGILLLLVAGGFAVLLTRFRVRDRGELRTTQ